MRCIISWAMLSLGLVVGLADTTRAAALQAPDFTAQVEPLGGTSKLVVTAFPPAKHHFNVYAPMDLEDTDRNWHWRPTSLQERRVQFTALRGNGVRNFAVSLYLCDDENTFCEKHRVLLKYPANAKASEPEKRPAPATPALKVQPTAPPVVATSPEPQAKASPAPEAAGPTASPGAASPEASAAPTATPKPAPPKKVTHDRNGFIENHPEAAFARAKQTDQIVIIDFYGIWCPACNLLDEQVFSTPDFRRAAGKAVKLKMDADAPESWALKSRYVVGGYPTVVFVTADGDEILRVVGFREKKSFLAELSTALKDRETSFAVLEQKAKAGDASAARRLARILIERQEYEAAAGYLPKKTFAPDDLLAQAEIGALKRRLETATGDDAGDIRKELVQRLHRAVRDFPISTEALEWQQQLANNYEAMGVPEKRKEHLMALVLLTEQLARQPEKLKTEDVTTPDLWQLAAQAHEDMGNDLNARHYWKRAAMEYGNKKGSGGLARGVNLERAYCLWKSGDVKGAETIYRSLEQRYPREFTFYYNHASMSFKLGSLASAEELASRAHQYSYGDNRLRTARLLAEIQLALGKPDAASKLVRDTLSSTPVPEDKKLRTHRYLNQLQELDRKIASSSSR